MEGRFYYLFGDLADSLSSLNPVASEVTQVVILHGADGQETTEDGMRYFYDIHSHATPLAKLQSYCPPNSKGPCKHHLAEYMPRKKKRICMHLGESSVSVTPLSAVSIPA